MKRSLDFSSSWYTISVLYSAC